MSGKGNERPRKRQIKRRPAGETPDGPRRVGLEIAKADYT
jgi:hypothetical protein